jgi:hypothetical protein
MIRFRDLLFYLVAPLVYLALVVVPVRQPRPESLVDCLAVPVCVAMLALYVVLFVSLVILVLLV